MDHTPDLSSAYTFFAQQALTNTFKFANADYFENSNGVTGTTLLNMVNPNLDARLPVIFGVEPSGGHCLLCDGYGYSSSTLFHHVNLGFAGDDDIWYALPDIETSDNNGAFNMVEACIYNIFTNGAGEIISGRVTDPAGAHRCPTPLSRRCAPAAARTRRRPMPTEFTPWPASPRARPTR